MNLGMGCGARFNHSSNDKGPELKEGTKHGHTWVLFYNPD